MIDRTNPPQLTKMTKLSALFENSRAYVLKKLTCRLINCLENTPFVYTNQLLLELSGGASKPVLITCVLTLEN